LPGWQAFNAEYSEHDFSVVTVALDVEPEKAQRWIEAASPSHPSLIDSAHLTNEVFGFNNVPMAVWIDETGTLVRPAEAASVEASALRDMDIPDTLPMPVRESLEEARKIPDVSTSYRSALVDWIVNGSESRFALTPAEVIDASLPRDAHQSAATANFELGQHLFALHGKDAAVPYWREAHRLDPDNWTYKRQAWTLETTRDGEPSDMLQPPTDVYEGSWLHDVLASGGGENYLTLPKL
jgi:hypothetical protein